MKRLTANLSIMVIMNFAFLPKARQNPKDLRLFEMYKNGEKTELNLTDASSKGMARNP